MGQSVLHLVGYIFGQQKSGQISILLLNTVLMNNDMQMPGAFYEASIPPAPVNIFMHKGKATCTEEEI